MTLDEAIKRNPFNPQRGNKSAYCRYLRYNVNGWYGIDSKEVRQRWEALADNYKPKLKADICIMDETPLTEWEDTGTNDTGEH